MDPTELDYRIRERYRDHVKKADALVLGVANRWAEIIGQEVATSGVQQNSPELTEKVI